MRKRDQYKKTKLQNKLPTLIIMCICLFLILFFGQKFSWSVAGFFAPTVPVTDEAVTAVTDGPLDNSDTANTDKNAAPTPTKTGSVVSHANQSAAQKLLPIIAAPK